MRIDQVIPSLATRDAIGAHTLALSAALRERGIDSDVYYGTCTEDVLDRARPLAALGRPSAERALLYQASIGDPMFEVFAERPETKMVNYHNITPVELFAWWEPSVAYELDLGRAQLARIAPHCRVAVADSAYNEAELKEVGFARTAVSPLLIEPRPAEPDLIVAQRLEKLRADGSPDFLFVGKVAPHKAQHDLVKMLAVYRRLYHPHARLHLVGLPVGTTYGPALDAFITELGLDDAVSVGPATPAELEAYYRGADVFVCASEHEGFCVPLIEAMAHDVPVVAYAATAVPETVAGAGVLLDSKAPVAFAATVQRVVGDARLRARLVAAGTRRASDFALPTTRAHFVDVLVDALGGVATGAG